MGTIVSQKSTNMFKIKIDVNKHRGQIKITFYLGQPNFMDDLDGRLPTQITEKTPVQIRVQVGNFPFKIIIILQNTDYQSKSKILIEIMPICAISNAEYRYCPPFKRNSKLSRWIV